MHIFAKAGKQIVNSEFVERWCIVEKEDAALVIASYGNTVPPLTIGRYQNREEAEQALGQLYGALIGGARGFDMPESCYYDEERAKRDARTRRKGGS